MSCSSASRFAVGNFVLVMPGPPSRRKIGSLGSPDVARMRVTGSAIRRDSGSARFSGTTRVPQSAAYLPPSVAYSHDSSVRSPACAPEGTETLSSGAKRRYPRASTASVMSARATMRAGVKARFDSMRLLFSWFAETVMTNVLSLCSERIGSPAVHSDRGSDSGLRRGRRRLDVRRGLGLATLASGKPLEPARQVPVPLAEQLHRRRQQHGADDRGVDQDRRRQPDTELLEHQEREHPEDREDADHDDRGAGDDAGGRLDPVCDRLVHARAAVEGLPDPAEDEDVVVHREAEQEHEQQQWHARVDPRRGAEAEQSLADAV